MCAQNRKPQIWLVCADTVRTVGPMSCKPKRRRPAVNLTLSPETLTAAKKVSFARGESLSVFVERGLRRLIAENARERKAAA